ncbi:hypothetical protein Micbo1qcDRAFT_164188 [Microdochium bolleyi]|uniref:Secreted protein n=1 Tax=Microdochium bolleyi TaxID=196109 RepID=A0A136J0L0_9PEZI|nr:hypothetical protein Micbo1qcDRAFT_164188 [Microdochium bolleyi]
MFIPTAAPPTTSLLATARLLLCLPRLAGLDEHRDRLSPVTIATVTLGDNTPQARSDCGCSNSRQLGLLHNTTSSRPSHHGMP